MRHWTHEVRLYYGANAQPPRTPGALAIGVNTIGQATDMEVLVGQGRPEIGLIKVKDLQTGVTTTIQTEHKTPCPTTTPSTAT